MKALVAVCLLVVVVSALPVDEEYLWKSWKATHAKTYTGANEEAMRKAIWSENLRKINQHNAEGNSHTLAINSFGDLSNEEFRYYYNGLRFNASAPRKGSAYVAPSNVELPSQVDWRQQGYVTPIKNQGQCGSCWAFSTTGSLEGQHFKKTGRLVSLSEQNLVDCSKSNYGCQGGFVDYAFSYIRSNGGIDTESSYPYEGRNGWCRFRRDSVGATDSGYIDIQRGSEQALQSASATVGPISVAVDASQFQFYNGGVYNNPSCSTTNLDHAVLVVGYGNYQGQDYWLVKNSWGTGWGMSGYLMMSRNRNNQCGIATSASYPLV